MLERKVDFASRKRVIAKALTWRAIATTTTAVIVFTMTGSFKLGLGAGVFDLFLKLALYYGHERAWGMVGWGYGANNSKLKNQSSK